MTKKSWQLAVAFTICTLLRADYPCKVGHCLRLMGFRYYFDTRSVRRCKYVRAHIPVGGLRASRVAARQDPAFAEKARAAVACTGCVTPPLTGGRRFRTSRPHRRPGAPTASPRGAAPRLGHRPAPHSPLLSGSPGKGEFLLAEKNWTKIGGPG